MCDLGSSWWEEAGQEREDLRGQPGWRAVEADLELGMGSAPENRCGSRRDGPARATLESQLSERAHLQRHACHRLFERLVEDLCAEHSIQSAASYAASSCGRAAGTQRGSGVGVGMAAGNLWRGNG